MYVSYCIHHIVKSRTFSILYGEQYGLRVEDYSSDEDGFHPLGERNGKFEPVLVFQVENSQLLCMNKHLYFLKVTLV